MTLVIQKSWEEFIKKRPSLGKVDLTPDRAFSLCLEAHSAGWTGGRAEAHEEIIEALKKAEPMFLMRFDGGRRFMTIKEAGVGFDTWRELVEIIGLVLEPDGSVRDITLQERVKIRDIADAYSSSK